MGEAYETVVHALLPSKEQVVYEEFFTRVLDACLVRDIRRTPTRLVADYEIAIQNVIKTIFPSIHVQGCFYHLTQSTWRRIQHGGLSAVYKDDSTVRHFCGMVDGLAFLPVADVKKGMRILQEYVPEGLEDLVEYFNVNYMSGAYSTVISRDGCMKFRRTAPRYPPATWNVHDSTITGRERTNNVSEGWNNGFSKLVGHANPSLWTAIKFVEGDIAMVEADVVRHARGLQPSRAQRKTRTTHQKTLLTLCQQFRAGQKDIRGFLDAIGHSNRLH